jgi:hypothetical protein
MTARPTPVTAVLQVNLVVPLAPCAPVEATLDYRPEDPYAVRIAFRTQATSTAVEWAFARQLLTDGLTAPSGAGDVRTWPSQVEGEPVVCLSLLSPTGSALFELPAGALLEFLACTYVAVPHDHECDHVDLDRELDDLLRSGPAA